MQTDTGCSTKGLQAGAGTPSRALCRGRGHPPQASWVLGSSLSRDTPDVDVTYPSPIK